VAGQYLAGCESATLDRGISGVLRKGGARNRHRRLYRQRLGSGVPVS